MRKEKPLLKIKISAPGIRKGHIPVPLLLRICGEAQAAVNRQAAALADKRSLRPGPATAEVARECTLDLVRLGDGSTTLDFVPASDQQSLLPTSIEAVSGVGTALKFVTSKRAKSSPPDIGVLDSLNSMGHIFDKGVKKLQWIVPARNGNKRVVADFVPETRSKIQARMQQPLPLGAESASAPEGTILEGLLELADGKCRIINPAVGVPTVLNFGEDKAENVYEARHKPVKVEIDAKSHKVKTIEITAAPDLLGRAQFFAGKTIDQLIVDQGVHPITNLEALSGAIPDEDVDEFVADIYRARES
jgi:hypothetical protein